MAKSFDMGPRKRAGTGKGEEPKPRKRRKRRAPKESNHPVLSARNTKRKLRDRRRDELFSKMVLTIAVFLAIAGGIVYLFSLPSVRISQVEAQGFPDPERVAVIAKEELSGRYYGLIPRDSFFFYPERAIRQSVLEEYPAVSSVSVGRNSFDSIILEGRPRVAAFHWCGGPDSLAAEDVTCYEVDAEGMVFKQAIIDASSTPMLHVYAVLDTASTTGAYPLKAKVEGANHLPDILRFVRSLNSLGVTVASIAIRGDEADLFVAPGTRITYVVGHEKEAEKSAKAALPKLNLKDGSILYIDLRFDGKVYLKRVGEE